MHLLTCGHVYSPFAISFASLEYSPLIFQLAMHVFTNVFELLYYVFYMYGFLWMAILMPDKIY